MAVVKGAEIDLKTAHRPRKTTQLFVRYNGKGEGEGEAEGEGEGGEI